MNWIKDIVRRGHIVYLKFRAGFRLTTTFAASEVLIVAPHPDDEVIGCGGLIARLVAEGRAPHVVVMTGGEGSHRGCCKTPEAEVKRARRRLTRDALGILGVPSANIHELDFVDGHISADDSQCAALQSLIAEINPSTVLVPHWGEGWPDHVNTARIVKDLVPAGVSVWEYCVWMWYYNVWRGLDWRNAAVLKLSAREHELKLKAVDAYVKPLAPCGKPWSGVLPKIFIDANCGNKELYFKYR